MIPKYSDKADQGIRLIKPRACSCCGKIHEFIPQNAVDSGNGRYWFNCECHSTLVIKLDKPDKVKKIYTNQKLKIHRIVYVSKVNFKISYGEIKKLKEQTEANNISMGVTGILLFNQSYFIGCIEGERSKLNDLFNKMSKDERHYDVEIISFEQVKEKRFQDWCVALMDASPALLKIRNEESAPTVFNPYFLSNQEVFNLLTETNDYYNGLDQNSNQKKAHK